MAEDLEAVIEWQRWKDETCDGCGQQMSESFDPELEGAYTATVVCCHACAARESGAKDTTDIRGAKVAVSLIPEAIDYVERRADG